MTISLDPIVGELVSVADPAVTEDSAVAAVLDWMRKDLTVPHPEMGRATAVCPFIGRALATGSVWMTRVTGARQPGDVMAIVRESLDRLESLPAVPDEQLKAIVLVFPTVTTAADSLELVDMVQYQMKPDVVEAGYMIGELGPWNETPPRANPTSWYRPNRSPVPAIALRRLHPHDVGFLISDCDETRARRLLVAYLRHVEWRRIPERAQHELTDRLGDWLLPTG